MLFTYLVIALIILQIIICIIMLFSPREIYPEQTLYSDKLKINKK